VLLKSGARSSHPNKKTTSANFFSLIPTKNQHIDALYIGHGYIRTTVRARTWSGSSCCATWQIVEQWLMLFPNK